MLFQWTAALALVAAVGSISGCANASGSDDDPANGQGSSQDLSAGGATAISCDVSGSTIASTDAVAKFSFKVTGFGTSTAKFVSTGWTVADKNGHALAADGEKSSVVAEGFSNGVDIHQCRAQSGKPLACGEFVMSLDNSDSEMPVTISLTKKSQYHQGTLTIDNTVNVGDNSGFLHAPLTCTIGS